MSAIEDFKKLLDERGEECWDMQTRGLWFGIKDNDHKYEAYEQRNGLILIEAGDLTPEQAIAATLGARKARAHPYGWEPDTGAFDVTRCECGCLNDISATYCNDCGGEIEIDVNHEKELWEYSPWHVPAIKHDDGSLEFDGRRYIAATLGGGECECIWNEHESTFLCSSCGTLLTNEISIEWPSHKVTPITLPNYCPNCGRKVKR